MADEAPRTPLRGVLFDAGGTLVGLHADRLAAALERRGHTASDLHAAFWRAAALIDTEFGPASVASDGQWEDWYRSWQSRLAEHAEVPAAVLHEAYDECDAQAFLWEHPVDGAAECLTRLRGAGLRVGVVSNADGRVAQALANAGLADLLEVVVDSTVVGVAKPDPAIFDHALDPLGLDPAETWYLGDTLVYDAAGAEAAGLQSWIVDHGGHHTLPHPRRVGSLAEFADLALTACSR